MENRPPELGIDAATLTSCARASAAAYLSEEEIRRRGKDLFQAEDIKYLISEEYDTEVLLILSKTEIIISFCGSESSKDFLVDAFFNHIPALGGHVHQGFYIALDAVWKPLIKAVRVWRKIQPHLSVVLTGHSLGGGLALLAAMKMITDDNKSVSSLVTFGQPAVGNKEFAEAVTASKFTYVRVTNKGDYVPMLPPSLKTIWAHSGQRFCIDKQGEIQEVDPGTSLINIIPLVFAMIQIVTANWNDKLKIKPAMLALFNMHDMEIYLKRCDDLALLREKKLSIEPILLS